MKKTILSFLLLAALLLGTALFASCVGPEPSSEPADQNTASHPDPVSRDPSSGPESASPENPPEPEQGPSDAPDPGPASEGLAYKERAGELTVTGLGGCTDRDIVIPASVDGKPVTEIDDEAFRGADITSVTIPRGVERIGESAFESCMSLKTVSLPGGMNGLAEDAFSKCVSLEEIHIPRMDYIGSSAFSGCASLRTVTIDGGPMFDSRVFSGCVSLKTAVFTGDAYALGNGLFDGCSSLREVTLPQTLEEISSSAFSGCVNLDAIRIPASVVSVGSYAFSGTHLKTVDYAGSREDWDKIAVSAGNDPLKSAEIRFG